MEVAAYFLLAMASGTLVEYALHRAMHTWLLRTPLGRFHAEHHRDGRSGRLACEAAKYQAAGLPLAALGFPLMGWGWALGCVTYAAMVGLSHWGQHASGEAFHAAHHARPRCNYGVLTSFWDRALGTYR